MAITWNEIEQAARVSGMTYLRRCGVDQDTAEDILQDACLRAWSKFDKFDQSKEFRPWWFRVIQRVLIDKLRREISPSRFVDVEVNNDISILDSIADTSNPCEEAMSMITSAKLLDQVKAISPLTAKAVVLIADGYTNDEAAKALGVLPGHLRISLYRTRKQMRQTCQI